MNKLFLTILAICMIFSITWIGFIQPLILRSMLIQQDARVKALEDKINEKTN